MDKQEIPTTKIIWEGEIENVKYRILRMAEDDCCVEELVPPSNIRVDTGINTQPSPNEHWEATDDETANRVYILAFLDAKKQVEDLSDFIVRGVRKT